MVKEEQPQEHLGIFPRKTVFTRRDGRQEIYEEGEPSEEARMRLAQIKAELEAGWLENIILECIGEDFVPPAIESKHEKLIDAIVDSVTDQTGRGIAGLLVMQFTIKGIAPGQCIRLHKAGGRGEHFSWKEGVPMRVLDTLYCTPLLRKYELLMLNESGAVMTRTLAENYPYTSVYKAVIKGGRTQWVEVIDALEDGELCPQAGLKHMIAKLFARKRKFHKMVDETLTTLDEVQGTFSCIEDIREFMTTYLNGVEHGARILETQMHSLLQVKEDCGELGGKLKNLTQMRSANKKHGNIGDIEIVSHDDQSVVLEAWDAKFGKTKLSKDLLQVREKLAKQPSTKTVGFVTDTEPHLCEETRQLMDFLRNTFGVEVHAISICRWINLQLEASGLSPQEAGRRWVMAFAECLCQKRRDRAPLDEPCHAWVEALHHHCLRWLEAKRTQP